MNHRIRRAQKMPKVKDGRTAVGVPYAHIVEGSAVQKSVWGMTRRHAARRAERLLRAKYPFV